MPTMYEIYDNNAVEYDELIVCEDYKENFKKAINEINDFSNQSIIEFGSGTGRCTMSYIDKVKHAHCFDRSGHMIEKAKVNLRDYLSKISFGKLDNLSIHEIDIKVDTILEGWAFGHTVFDGMENINKTIDSLVVNCERLVNPGGKVILVETLGTGVDKPNPPAEWMAIFYDLLENKYSYKKRVISTDYKFKSMNDAKRIMGFFFGNWIVAEIEKRNSTIIPEFTGIWYKTI